MSIPYIVQKKDLEIIVIKHRIGKPSYLFLHSSNLMKQIELSANPGQSLVNAMNNIGQTAVKMAQDYAYPTKSLEIGNAREALKFMYEVNGDLQDLFNKVFMGARDKRAQEMALSETPACWAFTLDYSKNFSYPKIQNDAIDKNGIFGFFTPRRIVYIDALPKKWLPDVKDPYQFNFVGF